jgi:hypothetical protein
MRAVLASASRGHRLIHCAASTRRRRFPRNESGLVAVREATDWLRNSILAPRCRFGAGQSFTAGRRQRPKGRKRRVSRIESQVLNLRFLTP